LKQLGELVGEILLLLLELNLKIDLLLTKLWITIDHDRSR